MLASLHRDSDVLGLGVQLGIWVSKMPQVNLMSRQARTRQLD